MSDKTISSPTTEENKINTQPLTDAVSKVESQVAKLEQKTKETIVSKTDAAIANTAGKVVEDIVSKSKQTSDKEELMHQLIQSAKSHGFGAFSQAENWTAAKQLGDIMVCELIAKELEKNKLLKDGKISTEALINLYIGKTFGDQTFMGEVNTEVSKGIDKYINDTYRNTLRKANKDFDKNVDNIIQKAEAEVGHVLIQGTQILEKVAKIDIQKSIDDAIKNSTSLDGINRQLSKTLLGRMLKPSLNKLFKSGINKVLERMTELGVIEKVTQLQEQIVKQQELINKAQQFIQEQEKVVRAYIDEAKKQAEAVVTQYANQVISDISSKIGIDLGGISGGLF